MLISNSTLRHTTPDHYVATTMFHCRLNILLFQFWKDVIFSDESKYNIFGCDGKKFGGYQTPNLILIFLILSFVLFKIDLKNFICIAWFLIMMMMMMMIIDDDDWRWWLMMMIDDDDWWWWLMMMIGDDWWLMMMMMLMIICLVPQALCCI